MLTEFDESVRAMVESREDLALLMHERRYFRSDKRLDFESHSKRQRLIPDAGFLLHLKSTTLGRSGPARQRLQMNFVEFDNGTLSVARLAAKFQAYNEWSKSVAGHEYLRQLYENYGGADQQANFRLLIIARDRTCGSDDRRLVDLFTLALNLPRTMRERIWLTTVALLRAQQPAYPSLSAPIWVRLRDARSWATALQIVQSASRPCTQQRALVAEKLSQLPQHALPPH